MHVVRNSSFFQLCDGAVSFRKQIAVLKMFNVSSCHMTKRNCNAPSVRQGRIEKALLNIICSRVKSRFNVEMNPHYEDVFTKSVWQSSLTLTWPIRLKTIGKGPSKTEAQHSAAALALGVLKNEKIITDDGNLELIDHTVAKYLTTNPVKPVQPTGKTQTYKEKISKAEFEMILRRFPKPKATVHNVYAEVVRYLQKEEFQAIPSYRLVGGIWRCTYRVRWPSLAVFTEEGNNKSQAAQAASLCVLHWLTAQGVLLRNGIPRLEMKMELPSPPVVSFPSGFEQDIGILFEEYKAIENILNESPKNVTELSQDDGAEVESSRVIARFISPDESEDRLAQQSLMLLSQYRRRLKFGKANQDLPIHKYRDELLKQLENNRVLVIKGEPGCGKSTQVPQFILDQWTEEGRGARCNIIVTQPRRVAAISLAERVADERGERVGEVVGYQVRLNSMLPRGPGGGILYLSSGMLLHYLKKSPTLAGVSHVILDEAHERDTNVDMLSVLLRRALAANHSLKLIVMSATIDASLFQNYFTAPLLEVPGFTHPVKENFMEDLIQENILIRNSVSEMPVPSVDADLVSSVIEWIHINRAEGAILCFLPGWAEIKSVMRALEDVIDRNTTFIVPAHSRLSYDEQKKIFSRPPPGVRKIILATNIAETSITIDDVKYVVDTGIHREQRLDTVSGISSLGNRWISQVSVKQRRGRAGRLHPGESFHLFTRQRFNKMDVFPVPEVLRVPLEQTVLDCKSFSENQSASEFLAELPQPPSSEAVEQAVIELEDLGALDKNENLTPLGKRIARFTTHPKLSKALINAVILRCIKPVLTISTTLSAEVNLFFGSLTEKEHIRTVKSEYNSTSDHIAISSIHQSLENRNYNAIRYFCDSSNINISNVYLISRLNRLFSQYLYECRILSKDEDYADSMSACNAHQSQSEMVGAALLSGIGNLITVRNWKITDGRLLRGTEVIVSELGQQASITADSVNYKRNIYGSPFLTHFYQINSLERRCLLIRESTILSPLTVLLFKSGKLMKEKYEPMSSPDKLDSANISLLTLQGKGNTEMLCEERQALQIMKLREIIDNVLHYYTSCEGYVNTHESYSIVNSFRDRLLTLVAKILEESISASS